MKNGKPSNLFPLLKAVRHPFADDQRMYEVSFNYKRVLFFVYEKG